LFSFQSIPCTGIKTITVKICEKFVHLLSLFSDYKLITLVEYFEYRRENPKEQIQWILKCGNILQCHKLHDVLYLWSADQYGSVLMNIVYQECQQHCGRFIISQNRLSYMAKSMSFAQTIGSRTSLLSKR
jgi:hypothetical protein